MAKYLDEDGLKAMLTKVKGKLDTKQATLVSGTNIKTVNGNNLLGSGNITIAGGSGAQEDTDVNFKSVTARETTTSTKGIRLKEREVIIGDLNSSQTFSASTLTEGGISYATNGNFYNLYYPESTGKIATQTWVNNQGFLTSATMDGYAKLSSENTFTAKQKFNAGADVTGNLTVGGSGDNYICMNNEGELGSTLMYPAGFFKYTTDEDDYYRYFYMPRNEEISAETSYYAVYSKEGNKDIADYALKSEIPSTSNFVDLTSAQEISGAKTFSSSSGIKTNRIANTLDKVIANYDSSTSATTFGNSSYATKLLGSATRPTYNGNDLALKSDSDAKQDELVSGTNIKTINNQSLLGSGNITIEGGGGSATIYVETTWSALKALRDAGTLVKGCFYRITDYQCTTTQAYTKSAGHQFDIVVVADSANSLNETALAVHHSGDTYFANSKLGAWRLKYCIDNDTTRFAWASSSGKGVVWYMKDEFENECFYDFKNIQYKRFTVDSGNVVDSDNPIDGMTDQIIEMIDNGMTCCSAQWYYGSYLVSQGWYADADSSTKYVVFGSTSSGKPFAVCPLDDNEFEWYYRFSDDSMNDSSLSASNNVYSNKTDVNHRKGSVGSNGWTANNVTALALDNNVFFGSGCYSNTFGSNCDSNTFGSDCDSNTFGSYCDSNTFGSGCYSNTFGSYCSYNTFGSYCDSNTFGSNCDSNTFGSYCYSNTFGSYCDSNTFGSDCCYNTFVSDCSHNYVCESTNYARYNILDDGVQYLKLEASGTGSSSSYLQYVHVHGGITGTSSAYKTITETRALAYTTDYYATGYQTKTI